jgi:hypothetical protein
VLNWKFQVLERFWPQGETFWRFWRLWEPLQNRIDFADAFDFGDIARYIDIT